MNKERTREMGMMGIKKYEAAKKMLRGGVTKEEVANILSIEITTTKHIEESTDYENFKSIEGAYKVGERQKKTIREVIEKEGIKHEQSVTIVADRYMAEQLKKQTELLEIISNKLAFIVEKLI